MNEVTKLRQRIRELELAEEGAKEAFAGIVQQNQELKVKCKHLNEQLDGMRSILRKTNLGDR